MIEIIAVKANFKAIFIITNIHSLVKFSLFVICLSDSFIKTKTDCSAKRFYCFTDGKF